MIEMSFPRTPSYRAVAVSVPSVTVAFAALDALGRYSSTRVGGLVRLEPLKISCRKRAFGSVMS